MLISVFPFSFHKNGAKFKKYSSFSHLLLYQRIQGKADHVYLLQGGDSRKAKAEERIQMRAGPDAESIVLVTVDKYIGEGFNFPYLDTVMLAMTATAEGKIEQFTGRLHRGYRTKVEVILYDYVDFHMIYSGVCEPLNPILRATKSERRSHKAISYNKFKAIVRTHRKALKIWIIKQ